MAGRVRRSRSQAVILPAWVGQSTAAPSRRAWMKVRAGFRRPAPLPALAPGTFRCRRRSSRLTIEPQEAQHDSPASAQVRTGRSPRRSEMLHEESFVCRPGTPGSARRRLGRCAPPTRQADLDPQGIPACQASWPRQESGSSAVSAAMPIRRFGLPGRLRSALGILEEVAQPGPGRTHRADALFAQPEPLQSRHRDAPPGLQGAAAPAQVRPAPARPGSAPAPVSVCATSRSSSPPTCSPGGLRFEDGTGEPEGQELIGRELCYICKRTTGSCTPSTTSSAPVWRLQLRQRTESADLRVGSRS